MAVVNTLSTSITNAVAKPIVYADSGQYGGLLRDKFETVAVAAADDDTSTYRIISVRSNVFMRAVLIYNDAITGGTSYDIGLYYNSTKLGGVVVPSCVALFGSAIDLSTAHSATGPLDVTNEATIGNFLLFKKKLWDMAGLTTDPDCMFDIVATANTVGSAAGNIGCRIVYAAAGA